MTGANHRRRSDTMYVNDSLAWKLKFNHSRVAMFLLPSGSGRISSGFLCVAVQKPSSSEQYFVAEAVFVFTPFERLD